MPKQFWVLRFELGSSFTHDAKPFLRNLAVDCLDYVWRGALKNIIAIVAVLCFSSCGAEGTAADEVARPKTANVKKIIDQVCEVSEMISFELAKYDISLPCKKKAAFNAFSLFDSDVNYNHSDYSKGLSPIPIGALKFDVEDQKKNGVYGDFSPPPGVYINLYASPNDRPYQRCNHNSETRIWCTHLFRIPNTDLVALLRFNAGSDANYPIWEDDKTIRSDRYPYAFYPKDEWPNLYKQIDNFVKNIAKPQFQHRTQNKQQL